MHLLDDRVLCHAQVHQAAALQQTHRTSLGHSALRPARSDRLQLRALHRLLCIQSIRGGRFRRPGDGLSRFAALVREPIQVQLGRVQSERSTAG